MNDRIDPNDRTEKRTAGPKRHAQAPMFAALGDETRLALVSRLCRGQPLSISQLAADSALSRQAITKHLRVLESAGIVRSSRAGRESRFQFDPQPIGDLRKYLDLVCEPAFVER